MAPHPEFRAIQSVASEGAWAWGDHPFPIVIYWRPRSPVYPLGRLRMELRRPWWEVRFFNETVYLSGEKPSKELLDALILAALETLTEPD